MPSLFDCRDRARPGEPTFTLLARDADAEAALFAWLRSRLSRLRSGEKPLTDLDQVREAVEVLRQMIDWRLAQDAPKPADPRPEGVWRDVIDAIAAAVAELARVTTRRVAKAQATGGSILAPWSCTVDGTEIGRARNRFGAMRLADFRHGTVVVKDDLTGDTWTRSGGVWKRGAPDPDGHG